MGLKERRLEVMDWVYLALNRDKLLVPVNTVMKFHEMRQLLDHPRNC
jgi:hypothetical protein